MGDMEPKKWLRCCELPEHLIEEILSWLPLQSLCRFRIVCQQWDAIISSTKFITTEWAEKPPNRKPWLVVQWQVLQGRRERILGGIVSEPKMSSCLALCFFTHTWKKTASISLSFLLQRELKSKYPIYCYGSAAGLFLVGTANVFVVSNPLTRSSLQLPPMSSIRHIFAIGIVAGDGDNGDTYKVVAVGMPSSGSVHVVEIYNSTDKSWRIAGHLPENVHVLGTGIGKRMDMVFCRGSFYYLTLINEEWNIMGFNIREGISISARLPDMANQKRFRPYLFTCESKVLVTTGIVIFGEQILQDVIIYEFEKVNMDSSSSWWKEVARMPPSLCERVNRCLKSVYCPFICCVGVGDCTCFIINGSTSVIEVVVYSGSENTWSWLPPFDDDTAYDKWAGYVMAFEPRPDMKVG